MSIGYRRDTLRRPFLPLGTPGERRWSTSRERRSWALPARLAPSARSPPLLRPHPQAITPPPPHAAPREPQAQRQRHGKSLGAGWPVHYFAGNNSTTGIVRCVRS